jgi:hypothetical protein
MRSRRTMSPMTIVVVRDEPAGSSEAGPSVFVAGFAAAVVVSAVAGGGADVVGAPADAAVVPVAAVAAVEAMALVAGAVDCCEKAEVERRRARRRAGIAERRFIARETIGRTGMRQAAMVRA